jgi:hypothetical protein
VIDADEEIKKAAQLAASVDVSIIVVGLSPEWESEGYDRPNLDLPLRLNDLVSAVADSNPNTVVVVQSVGCRRLYIHAQLWKGLGCAYALDRKRLDGALGSICRQ